MLKRASFSSCPWWGRGLSSTWWVGGDGKDTAETNRVGMGLIAVGRIAVGRVRRRELEKERFGE
jgi:hypothetical protein